jgi:hypothetical protein
MQELRKVTVIIDFDNYFGNDISKLNSELLEFSFKEIINICEQEFDNFSFLEIRLYGGWYKETTLTKQASALQQLLRNVSIFPKVFLSKVLNGSLELAVSLYIKPDFIWSHTHKEIDGIKRVRINHDCVDTACNENRENCPKFILYKFTEKKDKKCQVTDCKNLQKNVFKGAEQKMVDTLIACDVISISETENSAGLMLISDDQDLLPSLVMATIKSNPSASPILLGIHNEKLVGFLSSFISPFKIKVILLP